MDEQLTKLIREAQHQVSESKERHSVIAQIVDQILRSRKICRPLRGKFLSAVYQDIYHQVRQQLLGDVDGALDNRNEQRTSVREWANMLRDNAFRKVLDDARLQKLALAAQQFEPLTEERLYALRELLEAIQLSGRICRPHSNKIPVSFYNLIYEDAVSQTLTYVCEKIDKYDPEKGKTGNLMTWVNFRLDKLVIEAWNTFLCSDKLFTPESMQNLTISEQNPSLLEILREYIEEDVEDVFKQAHIKQHPDANFQRIILLRIAKLTWQEISQELGGIKITTLNNFLKRSCQKFAPKIREYLLK